MFPIDFLYDMYFVGSFGPFREGDDEDEFGGSEDLSMFTFAKGDEYPTISVQWDRSTGEVSPVDQTVYQRYC